MALIFVVFLLAIIPSIFVFINFFSYLFRGKIITRIQLWNVIQVVNVIVMPFIFLIFFDLGVKNECCSEGAVFSPEHSLGIYLLIIIAAIGFLLSIYRKTLFPPLGEFFLNLGLLAGLFINVLLIFHLQYRSDEFLLNLIGNVPICLLFLMQLAGNHKKVMGQMENNIYPSTSFASRILRAILAIDPILKYPVLTVILAPVLIIFSMLLVLFGQKPDSLIRAFTETYHHGFSQLDYLCANVECGGHFLCSVGANGHRGLVKPVRYGIRNGGLIICTRQLLIANAFEEWVQEKFPRIHRLIRKQYNKVGNLIHKHYHVFKRKGVSDFTYLMMKPLEWFFLLTLYFFDRNPENRIAVQYLPWKHREETKTTE